MNFKKLFEASPNLDAGYNYKVLGMIETNIDPQRIERYLFSNDFEYAAPVDWFEEDGRYFVAIYATEPYWFEKSVGKAGGSIIDIKIVNVKTVTPNDIENYQLNGLPSKENKIFYKWTDAKTAK